MGRVGITYHDVKKAISELQSAQKSLTVDHIRAELGTGSNSTIARFLREWKATHGLQPNDDGAIPSELLVTIKGLWNRLQAVAHEQTTQYQIEFEAQKSKIEQTLVQANQQQATLQTKVHQLEEQLHVKNAENKQLRDLLISEEKSHLITKERARALDDRKEELLAENKRLHEVINNLQKNLEHYQAETQKLQHEQAMLTEKQRNKFDQKILELQSKIESLAVERSNFQLQCEQLNKVNIALENERNDCLQKNIEIEKHYQTTHLKHTALQEKHHQLSQDHQQLEVKMDSKQIVITKLETQLAAQNKKLATLASELAAAHDKIQGLRDDHQYVLQEKSHLAGQLQQMQQVVTANGSAIVS